MFPQDIVPGYVLGELRKGRKKSLPFRVCIGVVYWHIDSLIHGGRHFLGLYVVISVACRTHSYDGDSVSGRAVRSLAG